VTLWRVLEDEKWLGELAVPLRTQRWRNEGLRWSEWRDRELGLGAPMAAAALAEALEHVMASEEQGGGLVVSLRTRRDQ
jgi:hypothetical protein